MSFSQLLRQEVAPIWQASFEHPFIKELGEGTLDLASFRYYVLQDSYYLSHFARVQTLGAAKAIELKTTARMAHHAQNTYEAELSLHENFAEKLGITEEEKASFIPAPTAYAYTSHMYRAAYEGHLGDIIASILPCYWLYYEIGERLKECKPEEPIYQAWISAYGSDWFRTLVEEQIMRLDQIAETVTESDRKRMKQHFIISSQYEYSFWEMAYTLEKWPVEEKIATR
ncbi:thiaminase II [Bacillus cytotoxicus]|uniref:Aminopyrimidine aminohydrolase n=1 Tax=Bacillus cytotoxicus (strain DSM 22905 / CIP 110041 / 391-98 / NVH 391-98) TaxID=315749 RepID=A7GPX2_BACCN|nr:thiaminase II [Bacillus cytotoxicus]ABS22180.1 transcriptional activator, TenA family [Bacillus cytotoxicus NVH 391-98]AWC32806.1 thiaminase II [Bacillus cytotoxicus]AWC36833.1 thiaminase II [Bacillus cytotoxicus]AWC44861.1 thiaminase II [Bacillus cytotoxicus]AWC61092.1 thiaminase II [Bacillus cytotoxicus]